MQLLSERIEWGLDSAFESLDKEIERLTEIINDSDPSNKKENRLIILNQFESQLLQKWRTIRKEIDTLSEV